MDKLGVFLCSGCGIGEAIDLDAVTEVAKENSATKTTLTHECLCAPEGLARFARAIADGRPQRRPHRRLLGTGQGARVRCSPRTSRPFTGCPYVSTAPGRTRMATKIRACSPRTSFAWALPASTRCKPGEKLEEEVSEIVLVVGGGRTGLESATAAADLGHPVVLVDKADSLGGRLTMLKSSAA